MVPQKNMSCHPQNEGGTSPGLFYHVPLTDTAPPTLQSACCPRCGLVLLVRPSSVAAPVFSLRLGEMHDFLQRAEDALQALRHAVEEMVQS